MRLRLLLITLEAMGPHSQDERPPRHPYWNSLNFFYAFSKALGGE